jgi:hypothetical protein
LGLRPRVAITPPFVSKEAVQRFSELTLRLAAAIKRADGEVAVARIGDASVLNSKASGVSYRR